jgi:hypothetical protein
MKLISSNYDKETGISTATISTPLGNFTGITKLHEEDKDIESNFTGCKYAEARAIAKYAKAHIKNLKLQIKTLENTIKVLESLKDYNKNSVEARAVRKQYFILQANLVDWIARVDSLEEKLYSEMQNRKQIINAIKEKYSKEDKEEAAE